MNTEERRVREIIRRWAAGGNHLQSLVDAIYPPEPIMLPAGLYLVKKRGTKGPIWVQEIEEPFEWIKHDDCEYRQITNPFLEIC